ncbi:MAG: hypothetical protein MJ074_05845 [Oscillospiraceae bacterium]|nr:hypothetical protein [Oscillospiraceae bacterium]
MKQNERELDPAAITKQAVKIAAAVMQAAGICRYDSPDKCRRVYTSEKTCEKCIESWLMAKAKKELQKGVRR